MKSGMPGESASALAAALCLCPLPSAAQLKPPESASKVKKVMLYNKIGGWVAVDGIAAIKATFEKLAAAKGLDLVQLDSDSAITLDYLKQFQVIVWNNNTNGAASVPRTAARQAILGYVDQGGGWLQLHGAGDHANTWAGLAEAMGTTMFRHASQGRAEVVLDSDALAHRELKWMLEGFPSADGSGDQVYIWARAIGQGRLLYNAIGFGMNNLMAQQDSIAPRLYWQNLRYAAGDFQNGCTTPGSAGFDPAARVHVEALCAEMPPRVNLKDTVISSRDSLRFAPETFGTCLYSYQSQYEILADGAKNRIPEHLIRITSRRQPFCATVVGYSGPVLLLKDLPAGVHRLAFSDSSDFQLEIPDTVRITVLEPGTLSFPSARAGRTQNHRPAAQPRSADGRLMRSQTEIRVRTPGFRR